MQGLDRGAPSHRHAEHVGELRILREGLDQGVGIVAVPRRLQRARQAFDGLFHALVRCHVNLQKRCLLPVYS